MEIIGYFLALLTGVTLGLMGGGGAILTVPVFVYVLHIDPKVAVALSLPVIGVTSFVGAMSHWRAGNANLRMAAMFGVVAMTGAFIGARLSDLLDGRVQLAFLGIVMLAAAISMLRSSGVKEEAGRRNLALILPVAFGVGLLTGLLGVGGGFLMVPALVILARLPMKQAVGTSLLVIAMNCASGFAGYINQLVIPWRFTLIFTAMAVAGVLVGTRLVKYVSPQSLRRGFAVLLLVIGTLILYKNRDVFIQSSTRSVTTLLTSRSDVLG